MQFAAIGHGGFEEMECMHEKSENRIILFPFLRDED